MRWPFTLDYATSFIIAQTCTALVLTALVLFWRFRSLSRWLLIAGIWLGALAVQVGPTLDDFRPALDAFVVKPGPHLFRNVLAWSVALATIASVVERRPVVALVAVLGEWPLWKLVEYLKDSDAELCALHLTWIALIVGLLCRRPAPRMVDVQEPPAERSYLLHDVGVFVAATLLAALVCVYVLDKRDGSADEWAYTFQAAVFAKGRAYAESGRCQNYLQNFWVFESNGRLFSQYPPGWPLFMTPFVWIRAVWLSGPASMGLMSWGIARLSRSAMRTYGRHEAPVSPRVIATAGTWGAALSMFATTILLNGASRFSHVWVVGLYAWSLEGLLQVITPGLSPRRQVQWGAVLGGAAVMALASRPADGAFAGLGIAVVFVYALVRGRIGWRALAACALAAALLGGFVLVILRLQLGRWFTTGYSLLPLIHPWIVPKYTMPQPDEWRYGFPLATGAYCWWPCALPVGVAGLAMLRGRAMTISLATAFAMLPYLAFLSFLEYSRTPQFEYGPRYAAQLIVPLAVGGGVALSPLTVAALRRDTAGRSALTRGAPVALVVFAVVSGWLRLVPLIWPPAMLDTVRHSAVERAIADAHLKNAIVVMADQTSGFDVRDMTTNLPLDLYPDQSVIKAVDKGTEQDAIACLRSTFPGRTLYVASGYQVTLTPVR